VPFVWKNRDTGATRRMEAIGGLVGVTQDAQTLALSPKVGWAVREASRLDTLLARLSQDHTTHPGHQPEDPDRDQWGWPPDLAAFYHHTDGAEMFGHDPASICRIVPANQIEPLDWGEASTSDDFVQFSYGPSGRAWHRFATLPDGAGLAINLDPNRRDPRPRDEGNRSYDRGFAPICLLRPGTVGRQPGQNPVVARDFTELLGLLLDGGPPAEWSDPQFAGHGDAETYTRLHD
jgi:hypothetical protein